MRKSLLICFIASGYLSMGQGQPTVLPSNIWGGKIYEFSNYLQNDSGFFSARRDTNFIPKQGGCMVFKTSDSTLYVSTGLFVGRKWKGIGSGGGSGVYNAGNGLTLASGTFKLDTTIGSTKNYALSLYDLLNGTKKNKSDSALNSASFTSRGQAQHLIDSLATLVQKSITAGWGWTLTSNIGKTDSTVVASKAYALYLYNLLNSIKVNVADTASMLSPYLTEAVAAVTYRPKVYTTVTVVDANYTVLGADDVIYLDTATTTRTLTIPSAATSNGRQLVVIYTGTAFKWNFAGSAVVDIIGNPIFFVTYNQSLTLVSNGSNWVAVNNSQDVNGIWARSSHVISPVGTTDTLSGLYQINYGGEAGGWISISTGVATTFSVNGNYRFIEFPSTSINTGLVLSSTQQGQKFHIRNSTAGSLTISPSYINLSNASIGTISANSALVLVYDGTNYKQF